ncbi:MAG: hypothetical protein IK127_04160 [Clostridia bacterium]|nr:hypothetical protein [Clostridia bacterium]
MAKLRENLPSSRWGRFLRWLREGDDVLDRSMAEALEAPAPAPADALVPLPIPRRLTRTRQRNLTRMEKRLRALYVVTAVLICSGIIALLLVTTAGLPDFGDPDNPANNEVPRHYIEKGLEETGAVNIVAGMILDYRAFDTLGESNVLFVAVCAVIILLRLHSGDPRERLRDEADERSREPGHDIILQVVAALIIPLILLFGVYVILNGHLSPGGGFSGGAVMGAALILFQLAFGERHTARFFTFRTFRIVSVLALGFYASAKAYSFFTGANHLPSFITPGIPGKIFSAGLIPYLNIAVGMVVCCTMYALYSLFRKGDV